MRLGHKCSLFCLSPPCKTKVSNTIEKQKQNHATPGQKTKIIMISIGGMHVPIQRNSWYKKTQDYTQNFNNKFIRE